ncbi:MAG: hypothetical protein WB771_13545 [Solirubrobacterales bacterium]
MEELRQLIRSGLFATLRYGPGLLDGGSAEDLSSRFVRVLLGE